MPIGVIGVSSAEQARATLFHATFNRLQLPADHIVHTLYSMNASIAYNRNLLTESALELGADWILYLDDDHILRTDTLLRLLAADKDVISAHYLQRQKPFGTVAMEAELPGGAGVWKRTDPQETGIVTVAGVGAGCLLVRRTVLDALSSPYWTIGQIHPTTWGDDIHFCNRVRQAGFDIHLDLDNYIGHIMQTIVWPSRDTERGWTANIAQDPQKGLICQVPMPLPGEF